MNSWEADGQASGAWLEVKFPSRAQSAKIWVLSKALPRDVIGQDVYNFAYSRVQWFQPPRHVRLSFAEGDTVQAELRASDYFQIITLPQTKQTSTVRHHHRGRLAKARRQRNRHRKNPRLSQKHPSSRSRWTLTKCTTSEGEQPVQAATLRLINPDKDIAGVNLVVSLRGKVLKQIPLASIPSSATTQQDVWIPGSFRR